MKKLLVFMSMLITVSIHISAKTTLTGKTIDGKSNSPLEYVNIQLLSADSVFIKGVTSANDGSFAFNELEKGNFILCATYIGYEKIYVSVSNLDANLNIGEIAMYNLEVMLDDVTITASGSIRRPDMHIIFPTLLQQKAATNGLNLLKNLQLSRVIVSPIDNSIKTSSGDNIQLRINGVEATKADIMALRPSDVIKINYHDNPGLRYGNVAAVIDYITKKKEQGGSISANLSNGISKTGYGENNLSAKFNHNKSEWSTNVYWERRNLEWTRENLEEYNLPTGKQTRIEIGEPTKTKYDNLHFSLNYNWQDADKYLLNIRLNDNYNNMPNSTNDRISTMHQGENTLSIYDNTSTIVNIPALDIYFQTKLKNNQQLIFNIVGTYLNTKSQRVYQERELNELSSDIFSKVDGEKYSLIAEGIYEKNFTKGKLSAGIKHTQSNLQNKYAGDTNETISMNTADTYAYAEYSSKIKHVDYSLGLGVMRTYNSQGGNKNENYIFRPNLRISYNLKENMFFRYNGYISSYSPSLSDLNNTSQSIDAFQIRRGNPLLKPTQFISNDLTVSWRNKMISIELFARYSYDHKPAMESTYFENGKFIRTINNQKGFHRINLQTSIQILPWEEYISIRITPFMNRYISNGTNYTHTYTNWGIRGSLMAMYKCWTFMADINTGYNTLWGETITKNEKSHSITVGYNRDKWTISASVLNPFSKRYELEIENRSSLAPYQQKAYSTKLSPLFIINLSVNLDFGKSYKAKNKRVNNQDSDTGILSGTK